MSDTEDAAYQDTGFQDYIPQSVDPGNSMLIATLLFCVVLIAFLPCLSRLAQRFQRHEEAPPRRAPGDTDSSEEEAKSKTPTEVAARLQNKKQKRDKKSTGRSVLSANEREKLRGPGPVSSGGVVSLYPITKGGQYTDDDEEEKEEESNENDNKSSSSGEVSIKSGRSAATAVMNALLTGSPHANPVRTHLQAHRVMREYSCDATAQSDILGKLSHDEVSIHDAVDDAHSSVFHQHDSLSPNQQNGDDKGSCCVRWHESWDQLLVVAEWNYESKRICKLGVPFVTQALVEGICEAVRVAIVGNLISTPALSAYVVVELMVGLTIQFLTGFQHSLATLCSHAVGSGRKRLAGQYVQIATICYTVCYIPIFVCWSFFAGDVIRWLGFDEETVAIGHDYALLFLFSKFLRGVADSVHGLLDTIELESYSTSFMSVQILLGTVAMLMVGLFTDTTTLQLIGVVKIAENAIGLVVNIGIVVVKGWFDTYLDGLVGDFALLNIKAVKALLKTACALSLGELLTYGEWELLTVFASVLGPAEVAAWGLLGTLWDALELVTEAVADAGEVRVAYLLGASQPSQAKLSSYKAIYLAMFCALFITSILFIGGEDIPTWLTKDPTLQRMCADLLPLFGLGNVALTIGTMSWTLVGCQARYALSTAVGFAGSWFITIPLAAVLTIGLKMDLQGQTAAVVIGYMVSGTINTFILLQTDWPKMSRRVIADNEESSSSSSSSSSGHDDDDDCSSIASGSKKEASVDGRSLSEAREMPSPNKQMGAAATKSDQGEEERAIKSSSVDGGGFFFNPLSYFSNKDAATDPLPIQNNEQQPQQSIFPSSDDLVDQLDSFRQSIVNAVGSSSPSTPESAKGSAKSEASSASRASASKEVDEELFNV